jgi:hypothetical protein
MRPALSLLVEQSAEGPFELYMLQGSDRSLCNRGDVGYSGGRDVLHKLPIAFEGLRLAGMNRVVINPPDEPSRNAREFVAGFAGLAPSTRWAQGSHKGRVLRGVFGRKESAEVVGAFDRFASDR